MIPPGDSLQTTCGGDDRGQSLDDCADTPVDETNVQQNGNGNIQPYVYDPVRDTYIDIEGYLDRAQNRYMY